MVALLEVLRLLCGVLLATFSAAYIRTIKLKEQLCLVAMVMGTLLASYGIIQKVGLDPVSWSYVPRGRVFSSCGHPNILAGVLAFTIPVSLSFLLTPRSVLSQSGIVAGVSIQGACLIFTYSRGGWIGAAVGLSVFLLLLGALARTSILLYWKPLAVGCISLALGVGCAAQSSSSYDPLSPDPSKAASVSLETRARLWKGTAAMIAAHPLAGVGPGKFNDVFPEYRPKDMIHINPSINVRYAHSEWLQLASEYGIPVATLLAIGVVMCFWRGLQALSGLPSESRALHAGLIAGTAALWIQASADITLRFSFTAVSACIGLGLVCGIPLWASRAIQKLSGPARIVVTAILIFALGWGAIYGVYFPSRSQSELREGQILKGRGKWEEALRKINASLRYDPENLDAYYEKAICLVEQSEYSAALEAYEAIEKLSPNYVQIHYNMGMIYVFQEEWKLAIERFEKADRIGSLPPDFLPETAKAILSSNLSSETKEQRMFKMFLNARFRDEARLQAIKLESLSDDAARLGQNFQASGRSARAVAAYEVTLQMLPGHRIALNNLAALYFQLGEQDSATECYRRFYTLYPDDDIGAVNLAGILATNGRVEEAQDILEAFLVRNPNSPRPRALLIRLRKEK